MNKDIITQSGGNNPFEFIFNGVLVRVVMSENNEPLFVAGDICEALDIANVSAALQKLSDTEKGITLVYSSKGSQQTIVVTEPGLYRLIFRSDKPEARNFQDWVFHEVLPTIRRTGSYTHTPQETNQITIFRQMVDVYEWQQQQIEAIKHHQEVMQFQQDTIQSEVHQLDSRVVKLERNPRKGYAKVGDYMFSIKRNESLERIGLLEQRAMQLSAELGYDIQQLDGDRLAFHNDVLKRL